MFKPSKIISNNLNQKFVIITLHCPLNLLHVIRSQWWTYHRCPLLSILYLVYTSQVFLLKKLMSEHYTILIRQNCNRGVFNYQTYLVTPKFTGDNDVYQFLVNTFVRVIACKWTVSLLKYIPIQYNTIIPINSISS